MGSRRGSSAPVEGLQIVQVDSPEVRRKYEAQLEEARAEAHARARELDRQLVQTRKDLDEMSRKFSQTFAERTELLQEIARLKAEKLNAPVPVAPIRPLGPDQTSRIAALERENEKLRQAVAAKREAAAVAMAAAPQRMGPVKPQSLAEQVKAWVMANRGEIAKAAKGKAPAAAPLSVRERGLLILGGGLLAGLVAALLFKRG